MFNFFKASKANTKEELQEPVVETNKEPQIRTRFMIWYGSDSKFGNWGHVALESSSDYFSVWPSGTVKPTSPLGKILPSTAKLSDYDMDREAEAESYIDSEGNDVPESQNFKGSPDDRHLREEREHRYLTPVPKDPDEKIEIMLTKAEDIQIKANIANLKEKIESGELEYCGITGELSFFGINLRKDCVNCITATKMALKGTFYENIATK